MADDVIKIAKRLIEVENTRALAQYVLQRSSTDEPSCNVDLNLRKVNTDALSIWKRICDRDQIPSGATTQFEHSAFMDWRWLQSEKQAHRFQVTVNTILGYV